MPPLCICPTNIYQYLSSVPLCICPIYIYLSVFCPPVHLFYRARYGDRLWVLNLVKQSEKTPREAALGAAFAAAVRHTNALAAAQRRRMQRTPDAQPSAEQQPTAAASTAAQPAATQQPVAAPPPAVRYLALDLHRLAKTDPGLLLRELQAVQAPALEDLGLFVLGPHPGRLRPAVPVCSCMITYHHNLAVHSCLCLRRSACPSPCCLLRGRQLDRKSVV